VPVSLEQLLAQPDFHLRLRAGAEPDTPALREPLAWAHSSDLQDPTPWLSAGGLLLTDGTQFDSDGEPAWADGYVGRLVAAGVAALGFATQVVHAEVPARLADACRRRGLILVEVAERAPFMAIIAFVNDAAAREQRERLEWSLAAHRTIARAALRPDGLNAVLKELEGQLGCWVALFDAAGYRVPTATRLPVPAAVEREIGEAVRSAFSRGTRGSLRISSAGADVTMQTLGRSRELHGVLAVGTQAPLGGAERDLVASVIALASIALDQTRTIEDARRRLRTGLFELMLSGASEVADSTAERLWGRLPVPPLRVCVLAAAHPGRALLAELEQYSERYRGRLFFAEHEERIVVVVHNEDTASLRKILGRHSAAAGGSSPVDWPQLQVGLAEASRAAERATSDRDFVQFDELAAEGMLGLLEAAGGAAVARRILLPLISRPAAERETLINAVTVWLSHNGAWDPSARELAVHRHTLRHRVAVVERLLSLDLSQFADRAELWAALQLAHRSTGTST
jgi:Purine catabolism regulatory protein-like family/PucR C-terminal helix-turn-helix domain